MIGVLLIAAGVGAWYVHRMLTRPQSFFETVPVAVDAAKPEVTAIAPLFPTDADPDGISEPDGTAQPTAEPAPAPQRLNVLLMGIDAYEDDSSTSGTMPHADATMVIAINFETDTVDLISLPRDTFTTAPGYRGFYKINGVFNVGGGMEDPNAGFLEMCRLAEQWLGGISIPYYYALDFQAVEDIVDAIGGIDFDVDQPFQAMTNGRYYGKGMHHLDGKAVMGYIRIRKGADGLDSSRTARQRRMMVALFNKLKTEGQLSQIPALINAASSGIYTNTTLAQTTTLAGYAVQLPTENIRTRSMSGSMHMVYDWAFCFVDQQNRIDLIKEVFGIDAEPVGICTTGYEAWLHNGGFITLKHIRQAEKVLSFAAEQHDSGAAFSDEQVALYQACYGSYTRLRDAFSDATDELCAFYLDPDAQGSEQKEAEKRWSAVIGEEQKTLEETTEAFAASVGYAEKIRWSLNLSVWDRDPDINEVYVDFR